MFKDKPKICLIYPPPSWTGYPPLSLVYLYSFLKTKYPCKMIDLNFIFFKLFNKNKNLWEKLDSSWEKSLFDTIYNRYPQILERLKKLIRNYEIIGLSVNKRNFSFAYRLGEIFREIHPFAKIIFGGPQTMFIYKKNELSDGFFWVVGEGEKPLLSIIENNSKSIYLFEEIECLDDIPFPEFGNLIPKLYSYRIPIISSRGCLYNCHFCTEKLLHKKFRYHSVPYIIEALKYLKNKYHLNTFVFCDSLINYNLDWLDKFCLHLIKERLNIKWEAQIRITHDFPLELAKSMKESGCYNLFVGLESASHKVLKLMNKGYSPDTAQDFLTTLKKAGLHFEVSIIVGYPQEDEEDFSQTVDFLIKNKYIIPKIAQINPFVDYKGDYPLQKFPDTKGIERTKVLLNILRRERIKYTQSFINNLIDRNN